MSSNAAPAQTIPFTHAGKTYEVSGITEPVKRAFEAWLLGRALAALAGIRPQIPAEEYEREKAGVFESATTARLGFHGPVSMAAMKTPDGLLALVALMFGCGPEEAVRLIGERGEDVKAMLARVMPQAPGGKAAPGKAAKAAKAARR